MAIVVAIPLAALIVVPVGLLAALPSLRVGDLYLALATLAFAVLIENTYFELPSVNNFDQGVDVPGPRASVTTCVLLPARRVLPGGRAARAQRQALDDRTGARRDAFERTPRRPRSASASCGRSWSCSA